MTLDDALAENGLQVLGHVAAKHLILLGPAGNFWKIFTQSSEYLDEEPDPIDRWSTRVISALADQFEAEPFFPFGGPPYAPFLDWALQSGQARSSPVGMLIHDQLGLMVSYRGALKFKANVDHPSATSENPCLTCIDQPCLSACPVDALTKDGYDTDRCAAYIREKGDQGCMNGCLVRLACPYSAGAERDPAQSRFHMEAFLRSR